MIHNILTKLLYFFLGNIIVGYIIFLRVFLKRLPRELYFLDPRNYRLTITMIFWITISIFMLYKSIKHIIYPNSTNNKIFSMITEKISTILYNALFQVYYNIITSIKNSYKSFYYFADQFYSYFGSKSETIIPFILYTVRLTIASAFLLDVFYFFTLHYFYKSLGLLCISVFLQVIIFMLRDFSNNLEEAKSFLDIKETLQENNDVVFTYVPSKGNEDIDLVYHVNQIILCQRLQGYFEIYDNVMLYYSAKVNIIVYSFYLIGWLFVLYNNIVFFN